MFAGAMAYPIDDVCIDGPGHLDGLRCYSLQTASATFFASSQGHVRYHMAICVPRKFIHVVRSQTYIAGPILLLGKRPDTTFWLLKMGWIRI